MTQWSQERVPEAWSILECAVTISAGTGAWDNQQVRVRGAKDPLGVIRDKEITQIAGSQAMHSLVRKDKDLKFNPGLHWQPVQLS